MGTTDGNREYHIGWGTLNLLDAGMRDLDFRGWLHNAENSSEWNDIYELELDGLCEAVAHVPRDEDDEITVNLYVEDWFKCLLPLTGCLWDADGLHLDMKYGEALLETGGYERRRPGTNIRSTPPLRGAKEGTVTLGSGTASNQQVDEGALSRLVRLVYLNDFSVLDQGDFVLNDRLVLRCAEMFGRNTSADVVMEVGYHPDGPVSFVVRGVAMPEDGFIEVGYNELCMRIPVDRSFVDAVASGEHNGVVDTRRYLSVHPGRVRDYERYSDRRAERAAFHPL